MVSMTKVHTRYRNKQQQIVPGVTTILGLLNKPALMYWAWQQGIQGLDYRKVTDKAANIGTIAHYLVECQLKGNKPELEEFSPANLKPALMAFEAFMDWWKQHRLRLVSSEISLVSEKYQYGGCLDIVARHIETGELWLNDIKTSKGIYDEMRYQVAAYCELWEENYPDSPIGLVNIIRLDKFTGEFAVHSFKDLGDALEIFHHLRQIYILRKPLDKKRNADRKYKHGQ